MALKISWTPQAKRGLSNTIAYLEENWTKKEILNLENTLNTLLSHISAEPLMYRSSLLASELRRALVDKNNYLVYQIDSSSNEIRIIDFRSTRANPIH